jgi:hypothetical protein
MVVRGNSSIRSSSKFSSSAANGKGCEKLMFFLNEE